MTKNKEGPDFHHCNEEPDINKEYCIISYDGGKTWYSEEVIYDNMQLIYYCPYCGEKLEADE